MTPFRLAFIIFLFSVGSAKAGNIDGNSIFKTCQSNTQVERAFCLGYTIGTWEGVKAGTAQVLIALKPKDAADLETLSNNWLQICVPRDVTNTQLRDVFIRHLEDNPATRHISARMLLMASFSKAFPCNP